MGDAGLEEVAVGEAPDEERTPLTEANIVETPRGTVPIGGLLRTTSAAVLDPAAAGAALVGALNRRSARPMKRQAPKRSTPTASHTSRSRKLRLCTGYPCSTSLWTAFVASGSAYTPSKHLVSCLSNYARRAGGTNWMGLQNLRTCWARTTGLDLEVLALRRVSVNALESLGNLCTCCL